MISIQLTVKQLHFISSCLKTTPSNGSVDPFTIFHFIGKSYLKTDVLYIVYLPQEHTLNSSLLVKFQRACFGHFPTSIEINILRIGDFWQIHIKSLNIIPPLIEISIQVRNLLLLLVVAAVICPSEGRLRIGRRISFVKC